MRPKTQVEIETTSDGVACMSAEKLYKLMQARQQPEEPLCWMPSLQVWGGGYTRLRFQPGPRLRLWMILIWTTRSSRSIGRRTHSCAWTSSWGCSGFPPADTGRRSTTSLPRPRPSSRADGLPRRTRRRFWPSKSYCSTAPARRRCGRRASLGGVLSCLPRP